MSIDKVLLYVFCFKLTFRISRVMLLIVYHMPRLEKRVNKRE